MSNKHWFVVHTKPRQEYIATENLRCQGFITYCPETIQSKRRRNRWQKVIEPLFPRYLFVQLNVGKDNFSPIRSTLGIIGLVRFGNQPAEMPELIIKAIQHQEQAMKNLSSEHPTWQKGDVLEILDGPFTGLKGIFQKKNSIERVVLLLDILGKQNHVSIKYNFLATAIQVEQIV